MRGHLDRLRPAALGLGTIPAYAGAPATNASHNTWRGLSPRMRGHQRWTPPRLPFRRTIPAYAGAPSSTPSRATAMRDYPRVCGGTTKPRSCTSNPTGLSPRMRGHLKYLYLQRDGTGTIPAYAGAPRILWAPSWAIRDYPRVCGGTVEDGDKMRFHQGLSPRMRGHPAYEQIMRYLGGTIPAYAGAPDATRESEHCHGDYPRVCGGTISP